MERRHRSLVSINAAAAAAADDDGDDAELAVSYCLVFNLAPTPERGACDLCIRAGAYVKRAERKLSRTSRRSLSAIRLLYTNNACQFICNLSTDDEFTSLTRPIAPRHSVAATSIATVCSRMKNAIRPRKLLSTFH